MTYEEYKKKELKLLSELTGYRMGSCQLRANIALNDKEIARIEFELKELRSKYEASMDV